MPIKNLIFDFGKVLVDYDFVPVLRPMFTNEEDFNAFYAAVSDPVFVAEGDTELIPYDQIIHRKQKEQPHFAEQWQMFLDKNVDLVIGEMPGMRDYLSALKKRGYRLFGLSNWCSHVHKIIEKYPIFDILDGYIVSSDIHVIKPSPVIYQTLLQRYDLKAEESLFVDDRQINVDAAKAVGMDGILFQSAPQLQAELEPLLLPTQINPNRLML